MRTDSLPCATAAGPSRTSPPSTTVPVRSLTTTRADHVELDRQRLDPGDEVRNRRAVGEQAPGSRQRRHRAHAPTPAPKLLIQRGGHATCRHEVGLAQRELHHVGGTHAGRMRHLHEATGRHAADGEMVDLHAGAAATGAEAAERERPLRERDERTDRAAKGRRHQNPALQAARIARRSRRDVEACAGLRVRSELAPSPGPPRCSRP